MILKIKCYSNIYIRNKMNSIIKNEIDYWHEATEDFTGDYWKKDHIRETEMNSIIRNEIDYWHEATEDWTEEDWRKDPDRYFSTFYFSLSGREKLKNVQQFIHDNNVRIRTKQKKL